MRIPVAVLLAIALSAAAEADEVHLVGGGTISGEIVERDALRLVVETGPGRVTLPMSRVTKVETSRSSLSEFQERARSLAPNDAAGWAALGGWADERDLRTRARSAYLKAVAIDPGNAPANAGLGRALLDGRWLTQEDSYRAQGLVPYEGAWVTPAEREEARRERAEADLSERAEREAEARVREAEARARGAEADAQRAEAAATTEAPSSDGIPYWPYVYGGGGGGYRPRRNPSCCQVVPRPHPRPNPPTRTPPAVRTTMATSARPASLPAPLPAPGKNR